MLSQDRVSLEYSRENIPWTLLYYLASKFGKVLVAEQLYVGDWGYSHYIQKLMDVFSAGTCRLYNVALTSMYRHDVSRMTSLLFSG